MRLKSFFVKYEKYGTLYVNVEILTVQDSFKNFEIFKTILDTRDISRFKSWF